MRDKPDHSLYSQRCACAVGMARMALALGFEAGVGVDALTSRPVLFIDTPNGQVSFHVYDKDRWMLAGLPAYKKPWNGKFRGTELAWCIWETKA